MDCSIRRITAADQVDQALDLVWKTFLEFEAPDYEAQGVDTFRSQIMENEAFRASFAGGDNRLWCAFDGEKLAGVLALQGDNHVCLAFVHRDYQRRGIATKLYQTMLKAVRLENPEVRRITVNSSPYGAPFYHSLGFYDQGPELTSGGIRFIPMTDAVYRSLNNMLANRPKVAVEPVVDGMTGFIMLDKNGRPKVALHIENELRWAMKKYRKLHPDKPLPHITPHVFRHPFCTNYANAGMDIKNLQYLMGHSDAGVTLNVYTHASYSHAASQMVSLGRSWSEVPALKTANCAAVS